LRHETKVGSHWMSL